MLLKKQRTKIIAMGKQLMAAGLVHDGQGNLSIYDSASGYIAITPSAVPYAEREIEDICVVNLQGELIEGRWLPTSEIALHLIFYQQRNDVQAVVHTHAAFATAFSITGQAVLPILLNESAMALGGPVPVAPYGRPGTQELAQLTCDAAKDGNAAIMAHHGLVTVGSSLREAYRATLAVEATAQALFYARCMGGVVQALDDDEVFSLYEMGKNYVPQEVQRALKR